MNRYESFRRRNRTDQDWNRDDERSRDWGSARDHSRRFDDQERRDWDNPYEMSGRFSNASRNSWTRRSAWSPENEWRDVDYDASTYGGHGSNEGFISERVRDRDRDYYSGAGAFNRGSSYSPGYSRKNDESFGEKVKRFFGLAPKGYTRSDERIRDDICDAIMRAGTFDPSDIEIRVESGIVILEGSVDSREAKRQAEDIAESALGARDVDNNLKVDRNRAYGSGQGNVTSIAGSQSATRSTK